MTLRGLPNRLRNLRAARRMTQAEVAQQLGVSQAYYSEMETGRKIPKADHIARLAALFEVDEYFLAPPATDDGTNLSPHDNALARAASDIMTALAAGNRSEKLWDAIQELNTEFEDRLRALLRRSLTEPEAAEALAVGVIYCNFMMASVRLYAPDTRAQGIEKRYREVGKLLLPLAEGLVEALHSGVRDGCRRNMSVFEVPGGAQLEPGYSEPAKLKKGAR